ncbi:MAG: dihydroorotate dehydrogenase electron transfer subunit [Bacteroidales bacterium]|jgi:dihydroorotate dehydrogenase electron transfer subunit|nr:dihydroorotate dehydrogenase electron transfer subunit [Lentimicrobiaceae bacterium]MDG1136089.1 dihydroorotate dehydrogenase electron transfer subunit [Bacteroidales bacterium]MDG1900795.1 dihydroorotate dehydrogenase electron transfer subunit [Bacteroidales bacterium]MDG2080821.1 dihydroorotate dehydrogenase electron transfer subunit [Bacteroidales bacterium]
MKRIQDFSVIDTIWLNSSSYILILKSERTLEKIEPGNFAEIKIPDTSDIFLRRPISVYDVDHDKNEISFYIKAIGKGTNKLGSLLPGNKVNIIYPLGNAYTPVKNKNVLIVGGGTGIAPFKLLGEQLSSLGSRVTYVFGARTSEEIVLSDIFSKFGEFNCTTEDGSLGEKGLVTLHSVFNNIKDFDIVYTCGPDPMMKAVSKIAEDNNVRCEASLENMMACGIGACLCCVTPTIRGNAVVCTEGPVFHSTDLKW